MGALWNLIEAIENIFRSLKKDEDRVLSFVDEYSLQYIR